MPRCKTCRDKFEARTFLQKYCRKKEDCLNAEALYATEKVKASNCRQIKTVKVKERKEKKEGLDNLKALADWKKDLEPLINRIVRTIDFEQRCISCGGGKKMFAGHYHSVGANDSLRFNLHNIHGQCFSCNGMKGGNVVKYNQGLKAIYSHEYKEFVECDLVRLYPRIDLDVFEIKFLMRRARQILKELPEERTYNERERIELRTELNNQLGIYLNNY